MLVTPSGIVMLVKLLHPLKASDPMLVTPSGIVMLVRFLHLENACPPMLVTPGWITTLFIVLLYVFQGAESLLTHSVIAPLPLIVKVPSSSSFHVRLSPQVPDATMVSLGGVGSGSGLSGSGLSGSGVPGFPPIEPCSRSMFTVVPRDSLIVFTNSMLPLLAMIRYSRSGR